MKTNKLPVSASCIIALILLLGLNSCASEMIQEESSPNVTLMLNTNLNSLGYMQTSEVNESSIKTLRVLVYEAFGSGETVVYGNRIGTSSLTNNLPGGENPVLKVEFKKCNQAAAFLIANEDPSWNLATEFIPAQQLKELAVTYGSTVSAPFKMYEETGLFSGQSDASRTVSLIRNVARIDVELTCKAAEMTNLAAGGKLQLTQARILNMPKKSQLGQAINNYTNDKGGYVDGIVIPFVENDNYRTDYKDGVFDGFTTLNNDKEAGSLTFYVPEHFVKEIDTYTYMTIEGKYYPQGSGKAINVVYTLPIGNTITTNKINGTESFSPADLTIERNVQYLMKAKISKIEQISDVVVSVQEWIPDPVSGDIEDKKISLNVSSIKTSIAQNAPDATLIQFWSNQPNEQVRILASGNMTPAGSTSNESFDVNTVFENLADTEGQTQRPANLWFNDTAATDQQYKSWGHVALKLNDNAVVSIGTIYTITLAAGSLHRTIKIEIDPTVKENQNK